MSGEQYFLARMLAAYLQSKLECFIAHLDTVLIGGDAPATFNTDGEDMLGEALPPRSYQRNLEERDALLAGNSEEYGFGIITEEEERKSNEAEALGAEE